MHPNFLVIGAPKSATTALCDSLGRHPDVFMSRPKEPFFFCYDHVYARGWEWYESLFADAAGHTAIGEGTTVYSQTGTYPNTVPRIVQHLPNARLIYIVREPLSRLQSYWVELLSQGLTMENFNAAIRNDPQYIDSALYWKQISAYRAHYPDDRILVLFYEDYRDRPHEVMERCFRFLGVDHTVRIESAERPRYISTGKRRDTPLTNWLRRKMPGFLALRDRTPSSLRRVAARVLKRGIEGKPEWDPAVRAWVLDQIRDDVRAFLRFYGRPETYWPLD